MIVCPIYFVSTRFALARIASQINDWHPLHSISLSVRLSLRPVVLSKYGAVGDAFEPTLHDALYRIPSAEGPANTVGQVLKAGYKLKDRVIRAAEVGIVVAPDNGA